ncbi:type II toxin-antitoxin system RatA family toxin [Erwiniaceae bacterium BAC15a-03b]|uniref:Type II toxin-antitoxin system RatA family toxin n=1 Tax=Winslowiella arboricola TaxID=2978220 RepID=A0A9J6PR87_9GAMM|nr:type II toxin-antitoxin system RatA family toxin [Winslowiella arboricola]MCU5774328.1 type II toxin-antitoxin system RatA family toxin [Winslowiella arboricola]MCU5778875.1 type II toxin-antitoxin system RatA family toxin [Winslowiella arboricola]
MTSFEKTEVVAFSQQQMYQLVADVAAYPDFLPWCHRVEILDSHNNTKRVRIGLQHKPPLQLSLTTVATFDPDNSLHLKLSEGSFLSAFEGEWRFTALSAQQCSITFTVSYRFANPLLKLALAPFFSMVVRMLPGLFIRRAQDIYPHSR